jgi:hypothetical protein
VLLLISEELETEVRVTAGFDCGFGVTDREISSAEDQIGGGFPDGYRDFLRRFGWLCFGHYEIFGLGADTPAHLEIISMTWDERRNGGLSSSLIPVLNDGGGNLYCVISDAVDNGSERVVFWDHVLGRDQLGQTIASSFDAWLEGLVRSLRDP